MKPIDLKVQKDRIGAEVLVRGRRPLRGYMFVVPPAYPVPEADLLLRLLNESDLFVPFERARRILLVNKKQIIYVKLPRASASRDWEGELRKKIKILLTTRQEITGTVTVDLPVERQRVKDFLNLNPLFFQMKAPRDTYLVNKEMLMGVEPVSEA